MATIPAPSSLEAQLLAAHAADDRHALVALYNQAAAQAEDPDASAFYLTHAYIFALEKDHASTQELHAQLKAMGREA